MAATIDRFRARRVQDVQTPAEEWLCLSLWLFVPCQCETTGFACRPLMRATGPLGCMHPRIRELLPLSRKKVVKSSSLRPRSSLLSRTSSCWHRPWHVRRHQSGYEHATQDRDRFIARALESLARPAESSLQGSGSKIEAAEDRARSRTQRARRDAREEGDMGGGCI